MFAGCSARATSVPDGRLAVWDSQTRSSLDSTWTTPGERRDKTRWAGWYIAAFLKVNEIINAVLAKVTTDRVNVHFIMTKT